MIRILGAVTLLILVATLTSQAEAYSTKGKGEEIPTPSQIKGEEIPTPSFFFPWTYFGGGDAVGGTNAVLRRRAQLYSWRGQCYARDRAGNWHWVDPRLC